MAGFHQHHLSNFGMPLPPPPPGRLAHIIRRAFPPSLHASLDVVVQFDEYGRVAGYQRPTQSNYGECEALHISGCEGLEVAWEGSTERSSNSGS